LGIPWPVRSFPSHGQPLEAPENSLFVSGLGRLAVARLLANGVAGLWLTHLTRQLSEDIAPGQVLIGRFGPSKAGRLSILVATVFGLGILFWVFAFTTVPRLSTMRASR
jgi:hypothetical protein